MLELLLWFPWAGLWFWVLEKLPFRDSVRRVSWVMTAIGVPLAWAVSQLPLQESVVLAIFGGMAMVVFVILAWLSSDPPKVETPDEIETRSSRSTPVCYRDHAPERCPWEVCRQRCIFAPEA
ncbi:hypothetical protein ABT052_01680 [Streptomyces sp. NPDC002766]|uniref:hypothetical protein n=1 Tax=Streptomyces sp. NPDC002766 TaxID=3154429 RepID=UPI003323FC27